MSTATEARAEWLAVDVQGSDRPAMIDRADAELVVPSRWQLVNGYARTERRIAGRRTYTYMHRLIVAAPAGIEVDHLNLDRLDNRRSNLRLATRSQNMANGGQRSDNSSGYRGVSWSSRDRIWQVHVRIDGKSRYVGRFDDLEAAARAYDAAAAAAFGQFARLNFPLEAA